VVLGAHRTPPNEDWFKQSSAWTVLREAMRPASFSGLSRSAR